MGFCLFEHAELSGFYFAVNAAHVDDVIQKSEKPAVCLIKMDQPIDGFESLALGNQDDIRALLMNTAKIGVRKAEIQALAGVRNRHPRPILFNNTNRVVLVRELLPEDFGAQEESSFATASQLYMNNDKPRFIVERPGVFVQRANAGGQIPRL